MKNIRWILISVTLRRASTFGDGRHLGSKSLRHCLATRSYRSPGPRVRPLRSDARGRGGQSAPSPAVDPNASYVLRFAGLPPPPPAGAFPRRGSAAYVLYDGEGLEIRSGASPCPVRAGSGSLEASYRALLGGLRDASRAGVRHVEVQGDDRAVVAQLLDRGAAPPDGTAKPLYDEAVGILEPSSPRGGGMKTHRVTLISPGKNGACRKRAAAAMDAMVSAAAAADPPSPVAARKSATSTPPPPAPAPSGGKATARTALQPAEIDREATYVLRFDGGARNNPSSVAGAGYVILHAESGAEVRSGYEYLGTGGTERTSNEAEYSALILGLEGARRAGVRRLHLEGDSELVVRQIEGTYACRSKRLQPLRRRAMGLLRGGGADGAGTAPFDIWGIRHIPREKNGRADELANMAMDLMNTWSSDG